MAPKLLSVPDNIVEGPDKFTFAMRFFSGDMGGRVPVTFIARDAVGLRTNILVVLSKVEWESGTGNSWNFWGYFVGMYPYGQEQPLASEFSGPHVQVKGHYFTDTRKGFVVVETK